MCIENDYSEFETRLGYSFKNKELLITAFTHTTYVFEHKREHFESNQRLEFIGDSVIDLVIGRVLYDSKPQESEGYLSKKRSIIVCEQSFANAARNLDIGNYLLLGKGEAQTGGSCKDSTLADAFESVIAAVYFDSGFEEAEKVVLYQLNDTIEATLAGTIFLDYKSKLLEVAQKRNNQHRISFKITDERGPAHQKEFDCEVCADGLFLASATGHSKKDAEQKCAAAAILEYEKVFGSVDVL